MADDIKIRIRTNKDIGNLIARGAASLGILGAISLFVSSPIISGLALLTSLAVVGPIQNYFTKILPESMPEARPLNLPENSKNLPTIISTLAKEAGLKRTPDLRILNRNWVLEFSRFATRYDGRRDGYNLTERFRYVMRNQFHKSVGQYAKSAFYGTTYPGVTITEPLTRVLNEKEATSIVARNVAHIADHHGRKRQIAAMVKSTAVLTGNFNLISNMWSLHGAEAVAAGITAGMVTYAVFPQLHRFDIIPSEDLETKIAQGVLRAVFLGTAFLTGAPEIIVAWTAAYLTERSASLVTRSWSRCTEFQADRVAAELTQNPQSLCDALHKMDEYNARIEPKPSRDSLITRAYRQAQSIFALYPSTKRRCERLEQMPLRFPQPPETGLT